MQNQLLLIAFAIALCFVAVSCENDSSNDLEGLSPQYEVKMEEYIFYANLEKYQEANTKRGDADYCQVPTQILKVSRLANTLSIEIARPRGYTVSYEIIWNGQIMESYPMMTNIFIRPISKDYQDLEGISTDVLVIDLEKTLKDLSASTLKNINFMVKEACSRNNIECMEDCDVPVSA